MKGFPDLPPLWLALFLVLNWAIARMVPGLTVGPAITGLSWGLIGGGLGLIAWSALWFWRRKTTIEPHHTPQSLIVEGPYRLSRNPIYLALVVILLGAVIGRGQPLCLLLLPAFIWVLQRRFVVPEEHALRTAFGPEAAQYLAGTRSWL